MPLTRSQLLKSNNVTEHLLERKVMLLYWLTMERHDAPIGGAEALD